VTLQPTTSPAPAAGPHLRGSQFAIPCWYMRGGTSKGPFFRTSDLPQDRAARDAILLAAMGSPGSAPDRRAGRRPPADQQGRDRVPQRAARRRPGVPVRPAPAGQQPGGYHGQLRQHAGRRGAVRDRVGPAGPSRRRYHGAGPHAEHRAGGRDIGADAGRRVRQVRRVRRGRRIDGVPGTAAAVTINFLDTAGSVCASLLPTGNTRTPWTSRASDPWTSPASTTAAAGHRQRRRPPRTGRETAAELNKDTGLKDRLEALRLAAAS
jgi:4-oxalomesaconate tautomerase